MCGIVGKFSLDERPIDWAEPDRKSTRLNSSHSQISYAVFCLKKKKKTTDLQATAYKLYQFCAGNLRPDIPSTIHIERAPGRGKVQCHTGADTRKVSLSSADP